MRHFFKVEDAPSQPFSSSEKELYSLHLCKGSECTLSTCGRWKITIFWKSLCEGCLKTEK